MHKLTELSNESLLPAHVINKLCILQSQLLSDLSDVLAVAANRRCACIKKQKDEEFVKIP
jgi:hypothetical protein